MAILEQDSYDTALKALSRRGLAVANNSDKTQPFAFVDIDEKAFKNLGQYTLFPKQKIAIFLNNVARSKAKLVIIDIDFLHKEGANIAKLKAAMKAYADNPQNPPLLLVRQISNIINKTGDLSASIYDGLVDKSPHIHWVSAVFRGKKEGGIIRLQEEWIATCRNRYLVVLPAVNLLVQQLLLEKTGERFQKKFNQITGDKKYNKICINKKNSNLVNNLYLDLDKQFNLGSDDKKNWVRFLYAQNLPMPYIPARSKEGYDEPFIGKPDAIALLEENSVIIKQLENKIVILGVSFSSSKDMHHTPLSTRMPGSLAIINSINSLVSYGMVRTIYCYEIVIAFLVLNFILIVSVLGIRFLFIILGIHSLFITFMKFIFNKKKLLKHITLFVNISFDLLITILLTIITAFVLNNSYPFLLNKNIWLNVTILLAFISFIISIASYDGRIHYFLHSIWKITLNKFKR